MDSDPSTGPPRVEPDRPTRDRLRYLRRQRGAKAEQIVRSNESYWTRTLAIAFLDDLDTLAAEDPLLAQQMAPAAVIIVERAQHARQDSWWSATEQRSFHAVAQAITASCARRSGQLETAQSVIAAAVAKVETTTVEQWAEGEVLYRQAVILADGQGPAPALPIVMRAITACEQSGHLIAAADAWLFLGILQRQQGQASAALAAYRQALALNNASDRGRRNRLALPLAIAIAALESGSSRDCELAGRLLQEAARWEGPRSYRLRVLWAQGRLLQRLGVVRHAGRKYRAACRIAGEEDAATLAQLSLDIAELVHSYGADQNTEVAFQHLGRHLAQRGTISQADQAAVRHWTEEWQRSAQLKAQAAECPSPSEPTPGRCTRRPQ